MNNLRIRADIIFMLFLSLICALILSGSRAIVGDRAELPPETIKAINSIQLIASHEKSLYDDFHNAYTLLSTGKYRIWKNCQNPAVYACQAMGSGMWDQITIVFVYNSFNDEVVGLRVTDEKETVGIGSRIKDEEYYRQFNHWKENSNIDAISGATTSSNAVEVLLKKALKEIKKCYKS